jgi:O-acetyl-ADP-ribose deacetylase (regulator of RNase III)
MRVDAIVNAANTMLQAGGGVSGAIFRAAGNNKLQAACDKLAPIKTGEAVITSGFDLPAKYIIHAAGPVYQDGNNGEEELLRICYINSLNLANKKNCKSVAFPLISSGIFGYPKDEALTVATKTIGDWLLKNNDDIEVSLVVFDTTAFEVSKKLLGNIEEFIDGNYIDNSSGFFAASDSFDSKASTRRWFGFRQSETAKKEKARSAPQKMRSEANAEITGIKEFMPHRALDYYIKHLDEPFSLILLKLIDAKGRTDVDVYKRANIDRKLFSKIRNVKNYAPSKKTVVALAIALELTLAETDDLLERAGFALSRSVMFDVIVEYFIASRQYDIFEINNVLFKYDQPLLGG